MKKVWLLTAALIAASCGTQKKNNVTVNKDNTVISESVPSVETERAHYVGGHEAFALELLAKANVARDENVIVSPFSAGMALSMLAEGAEGGTREEIMAALRDIPFSEGTAYGVQAGNPSDMEKALSDAKAYAGEAGMELNSANSVWASDGFKVKEGFRSALASKYSAEYFGRDFSSPHTVDEINSWCSGKTNGKIPSIIEEISPEQKLFLINALYFKAAWSHPFPSHVTAKDVFHGMKEDRSIDFMHITEEFGYYGDDALQAVVLPYSGGSLGMVVVLPAKGADINAFISSLDYRMLREGMSSMDYGKKVELTLPKFKVESDMVLNSTLKAMGVDRVFDARAELGGITDAGVAVDQVRQKCYVSVDEKGSEAAAVTSIGVRLTAMPFPQEPVVMNVDRPFLFAIMNLETNEILFEGKIANIHE